MDRLGPHGRFLCIAHALALSVVCLALANCAGNTVTQRTDTQRDVATSDTPKAQPTPRPKRQAKAPAGVKSGSYSAIGLASWYGADFHGKPTANGETFNMHSLTAAHRTLPLQCTVKVTNLANNRSLMVRVNDRGPFTGNRLIDLSAQSAKLLGFYDRGVAKVKVELVSLTRAREQVTASAASP